MRRRSSSNQGSKVGLDIDKLEKIKEPHLSGAYIRSLVKQLTTSTRTKEQQETLDAEGLSSSSNQNLSKTSDGLVGTQQSQPPQQPPPQQQQHKKQVRRRLHTSRPYQERLLNMAEARREIVTALKFHRAAMKQANDQQQQQQQQQNQKQKQKQSDTDMGTSRQTLLQQPLEQEGKSKSRRNPRIYASNTSNSCFSNYVENFSYPAFAYPPYNNNPYSWPFPPVAPPPLPPENLNFPLPNQTLGLNLNLQEFSNLDSNFYHYTENPTIYNLNSSPSSTSSSSPALQVSMQEVPNLGMPQEGEGEGEGVPMGIPNGGMLEGGDLGLHHAMDDKEMAEIRSIGEQHQMEWNDTVNLVTSAWWFKFLKTMEIDPEKDKEVVVVDDDDFGNFPFHEVMEFQFPSWLNGNDDGCCFEQHLMSDYCSDDYMQDHPALPCMEIEEIEGIDGEWLS